MGKTKVFLLGGQSNMQGSGDIHDLDPSYGTSPANIKIWNPEKKWIDLVPGHDGREQFGPEISFGHDISKQIPGDDLLFIKYAAGGTALYNDWSPSLKGEQYKTFMERTTLAIEDLKYSNIDFEIIGMLWFQGESDAAEDQAETYQENLTLFIAHMREHFGVPNLPFIMARVLSFYGGETGQAEIVRQAQVNIGDTDPNAAWFDTDDSPVIHPIENAGHYNAEGNLLNGHRFAEAFMKLSLTHMPLRGEIAR